MQTVVLISGLGRSGTTIMEFVLSSMPNVVGLGEVYPLLRDFEGYWYNASHTICSCGKTMNNCVFWREIGEELLFLSSIGERFKALVRHFEQFFPNSIMVDSSGNIDRRLGIVNVCKQDSEINFKTVYMVRDVRAWANSMKKADKRYRREGIRYRWIPNGLYFIRWYQRNIEMLRYHRKQKVPTIVIGYEGFVLDIDRYINKLKDFLGVHGNYELDLSSETSHIVTGNRIRLDPDKRRKLIYDYSWLGSYSAILMSAFLPFVMQLNKKLLYDGDSLYLNKDKVFCF